MGAEPAIDDDTWRAGPATAGAQLVSRLLDQHGVAALIWHRGSVPWANETALDLIAEAELEEDEASRLRRLAHCIHGSAVLGDLDPGEERTLSLEVSTARALLTVSAVAFRAHANDEVLVTFRAPLERPVDPAHVARLEAMLDAASDVITVIDQQGRVRYSNPAAGRITGLFGSSANGSNIVEFVHPEDHVAALDAFDRGVLRGEQVDPFILRMRMADGDWHHTEVTLAGTVDLEGGGTGHVVSLRDVSDRVRRDAEAESHRRHLESLVENIDDVIVILGPDLSVSWTSPGIERFVDAPAYTNVGESAFNDMHPDDVEGVVAAIGEAMAEPNGRSRASLRLRHARFGWRWIEAAVVNRLDDPDVEGLVCTLRDVTDQRDEAGELARLRAQDRDEMGRLREADRLKDRFLATVSHELRTPLTAVRGFGAVLRQQWPRLGDAERDQLLDRINANATSMETMIEQLLDFSRLQAGRVEVDLEPLDLGELVEEMVDSLDLHLLEHQVVVDTNELRVVGDRFAFGHVLRNLLTNAAKYSNPGTRIDIEAERIGDTVHLHVRDQGIGIAPEDQRRVFQSFFQSAPALSDRRGTGVGLNVARRYAQLQAGSLELTSELGAGTTFTFTLPAAD